VDTRAYLQWCVETHQARRRIIRKRMERLAKIGVMVAMVAVWIAGWMLR
jgi:hypothetical protein